MKFGFGRRKNGVFKITRDLEHLCRKLSTDSCRAINFQHFSIKRTKIFGQYTFRPLYIKIYRYVFKDKFKDNIDTV